MRLQRSQNAKSYQLATWAKQDIVAAIKLATELNNGKQIILLGSSYSASLSLILVTELPAVKAVITFSPGEYLKKVNVAESIADLTIPVYVTSSQQEIQPTTDLVRNINPKLVTQFKPLITGHHGTRALWPHLAGSEAYWQSLVNFLESLT